jgi:hypothetical protein
MPGSDDEGSGGGGSRGPRASGSAPPRQNGLEASGLVVGSKFNEEAAAWYSEMQRSKKFEDAGVDPWTAVGGELDQIVFEKKLEAMTDPAAYKLSRQTAMNSIKLAVNEAYKSTYENYRASGYPPEKCKDKALAAAKSVMETQLESVQKLYGSNDQLFHHGAKTMNTKDLTAGGERSFKVR